MKAEKIYNLIARLDTTASGYALTYILILTTFVGWYGCSGSFLGQPNISEDNILAYKYLHYIIMALLLPLIIANATNAAIVYYNGIPSKYVTKGKCYYYIARTLLNMAAFVIVLEWQLCLVNVSVAIFPYFFSLAMIASLMFHIAEHAGRHSG